jgi:RimJ/RimL family protein N-acetyltransferase
MTIKGFGIELVRLHKEHIETVRQWRNDERINRFMDFREYISEADQKRWFEQLNPETDYYFLIQQHSEFHGLIHFSHIDWQKNVGQSGLFIKTEAFQGTPLPVSASALLLDYFFTHTPLLGVEAKVMVNNTVALHYNESLGFVHILSEHPETYYRLMLSKEAFYNVFQKNLSLLQKVYGSEMEVILPEN